MVNSKHCKKKLVSKVFAGLEAKIGQKLDQNLMSKFTSGFVAGAVLVDKWTKDIQVHHNCSHLQFEFFFPRICSTNSDASGALLEECVPQHNRRAQVWFMSGDQMVAIDVSVGNVLLT